jgi:hypothetical protein
MTPNTAAAIFAWIFVAIPASLFCPWAASVLEEKFFPVLVDDKISDVVVEGDSLCWTWAWRKARNAAPISFRYYFQTNTSGPIPTIVYRPNVGPIQPLERSTGTYSLRFCTVIPPGVSHDVPMKVTGVAEYSVPHGLWFVRESLPEVSWVGKARP